MDCRIKSGNDDLTMRTDFFDFDPRHAQEPLRFQEVGGSLRRELTDGAQPILDMVGVDHLAVFKGVNVDRHQLE